MPTKPVLLVHGIWDTGAKLGPLRRGLERAGLGPIEAIDLSPNDGRASILELASQVEHAARHLALRESCERIDIVGFSMGALVTRTYLQRLGGKERVRRFVSISGPHHGTVLAFALPHVGTRDMRPGSRLLTELATDPDPFGDVEVHVMYTPFDLMIVPATSSRIPGARSETRLPIPLHRWMIEDPRAIQRVAELLM
jgi:triacylglycerol lipase